MGNSTYGLSAIKSALTNSTYGLSALQGYLANSTYGLSALQSLLANSTYGLSAIKTVLVNSTYGLSALQGYLANSTYGLSALQSYLANSTYGLSAIKTAVNNCLTSSSFSSTVTSRINSNTSIPLNKMMGGGTVTKLTPVNHVNLATNSVGVDLVNLSTNCILMGITSHIWIYYNDSASSTAVYYFSLYLNGSLFDRFVTTRTRYDTNQHWIIPVGSPSNGSIAGAYPAGSYGTITMPSPSSYRKADGSALAIPIGQIGIPCTSIRLRFDSRSGTTNTSDSMYTFDLAVIYT